MVANHLIRRVSISFWVAAAATVSFMGLATPIHAVEYNADAPITAVRVTPQGAVVTRSAAVRVDGGEHSLVIEGLPAGLDMSRLVLSLGDDRVRMGSLRARRVSGAALTGESHQALQDELEELLYRRGQIDDRVAAAESQLKLVESLTQGRVESSVASAEDFAALMAQLNESSHAARISIRDEQREGARLDLQIQRQRELLDRFYQQSRHSQLAVISIAVPEAMELGFSASYPVQGARWNWSYEARLDTQRSFLEITRQVVVTQQTGESWTDVALTISTSAPQSRVAPPAHLDQLVSLRSKDDVLQRHAKSMAAAAARNAQPAAAMGGIMEESVASDSFLISSVQTTGSAFQVDYRIPGVVSVPFGDDQQLFAIDKRGLAVDLLAMSRPLRDPYVYLEARFSAEDDFPIQAGHMQFYRDGNYIGSWHIDEIFPGEETRLPFGVDERIRVRVAADEEASDGGGTFRRTAVESVRKRILITSFHSEVKEIDVLASVPISQSDDIEVDFDDDGTQPTERDVRGNRGEVRWRRSLEPNREQTIKHFYSIRYPKDEQLNYRYAPGG